MKPIAAAGIAFVVGMALVVGFAPRDAAPEDADALREAGMALFVDGGAPPVWSEGDAWRVQFDDNEPVCWMVVTVADAEGYRQGVWCPTDEAPGIAAGLEGYQNPWLGTFTRDLQGVGREQTVRFYDWPLEDGKSWPTSWFGSDVIVTARAIPRYMGPNGIEPAYELVMTYAGGDAEALRYDYVPSLGWWSRLEFNTGSTFQVHERVSGWREGAVYGVGADRLDLVKTTTSPLPISPSFEMMEEDDVLVAIARHGGIYAHRFSLVDPQGNKVWESNDAWLLGADATVDYVTDSVPGVWSIQEVASATLSEIEYLVRGVALEEWDR